MPSDSPGTSSPDARGVHLFEEHGQRRLRASRWIACGEIVLTMRGRIVDVPGRYTLQVGVAEHLAPVGLPRVEGLDDGLLWPYLEHSFDPSTRIVGVGVVALVDLAVGEAVSFDYNSTEWDIADPFRCSTTGRLVRGYRHLGASERHSIRHLAAPHLLALARAGRSTRPEVR